MKTIYAQGKYKVTFNNYINGYEVGDTQMGTIDYAGDNIQELTKEVIADQLEDHFQIKFEEIQNKTVIGIFFESNEQDWPVAIMYKD